MNPSFVLCIHLLYCKLDGSWRYKDSHRRAQSMIRESDKTGAQWLVLGEGLLTNILGHAVEWTNPAMGLQWVLGYTTQNFYIWSLHFPCCQAAIDLYEILLQELISTKEIHFVQGYASFPYSILFYDLFSFPPVKTSLNVFPGCRSPSWIGGGFCCNCITFNLTNASLFLTWIVAEGIPSKSPTKNSQSWSDKESNLQ